MPLRTKLCLILYFTHNFRHMKKFALLNIFGLLCILGSAQLVTTDPPLPLVTEPVTVIFDATQGSGGLAGYTGDVYAHTGLITEFSTGGSDWKYHTQWGVNTPETKMARIGQDLYSLQINPSIRDYYGAPSNEQILKMAFVFRSATTVNGNYLEGKTATGGDIFVDVYEAGLSVTFSQPSVFPVILELNDAFITEVNANEADSLSLFIDNVLVKKVAGNTLSDTISAGNYGKFLVKTVAENESGTVADSFYYHVRSEVAVEPLPAGIRDGINYTDENTVILSLMAPYKEFIYVIGDFNDWDISADHYMKKTPDGMRFWVEIGGLVPGKEYVFQYFIDGQLKVGDPYADKISDPWNDAYISPATYPNLIQYPTGKTTGIATVLQTSQPDYDWEVEDFVPPAITDLVIYELLVRDFTTKHSYAAVIDSLDYLQSLGVNAVELMPVNEFEGNISWGYNPSFYFAPDKYYGPKNDLKRLIDECHKRGMAVYIDLVLNHAYDQCPLVQMYFDGSKPTAQNPWFNVNHNFQNPDAQWGNDFNHESLYTQDLVDSINSYWMNEYKVDGFRFDFTKGFGNNIKSASSDPWGSNYDADRIRLLKRMADEIWERNPSAVVIFEHLAVNTEEKELADYGILMWGNMNGAYAEAAMGWHDNGKSNFAGISYKTRGWANPHLIGYMESHDEERIPYKCYKWGNGFEDYQVKDTAVALERMLLNTVFFLTVPGPKMIWQFGEMGYDVRIDSNGRTGPKPVLWYYLDNFRRKYLSDFYGALNKLRTEHPAFESTNFTMYVAAAMKKIVIVHPEMDVVVVGNFDVKPGNIVPGFTRTGTWYEYFTGAPFEVSDVAAQMPLEPGEYRLFTSSMLETPQIGTGLPEPPGEASGMLRVFPNPGRDFNIEVRLDKSGELSLEVFSMTGTRIAAIHQGKLPGGTHSFNWSARMAGSGAYLLKAAAGSITDSVILVAD